MRYEIGFWILVIMCIGISINNHDKVSELESQIRIKDSVLVCKSIDSINNYVYPKPRHADKLSLFRIPE
jgi:hypothetical protein